MYPMIKFCIIKFISFEDNFQVNILGFESKYWCTYYKEGCQEYSLSILLVISRIRKDQVLMVVALMHEISYHDL